MTYEEDLLHKRLKKLLKAAPDGRVEFKNYKEMCEKLKLHIKQGRAKIIQLEKIGCLCNMEKIKIQGKNPKFIYDSVYDYMWCDELFAQRVTNTKKYKEIYKIKEKKGIYGIYIDDTLYYIGSSLNIRHRLLDHCTEIYKEHQTAYKYCILKELIDKGGKLNFKILDSTITEENRYEVEYKYIRQLHPLLNGTGMGFQHIMYTSRKHQLIAEYTERISQNNKQIQGLQKENELLQQKLEILNTLDDNVKIDEIMQRLIS